MDRDQRLRSYVFAHLRLWWSPEQISTRLREEYPGDTTMRISPEAIYLFLDVLPKKDLRKELTAHLRQYHRTRRKRKASPEQRGKIPAMISISQRPPEAAHRMVPGHWEGDLIIGRGNRSALGTLVERTTRTTLLVPLKAKDAPAVRRAFARTMRTLPEQVVRSLTYDQGKEMAEHERFTKDTRIQVYFAHPHSPWERGTNENTNGLVRQFFPKGTDFSTVSRRQIRRVQDLLNGRPRKILHWRTPAEAFHDVIHSSPVALGN